MLDIHLINGDIVVVFRGLFLGGLLEYDIEAMAAISLVVNLKLTVAVIHLS